MIFYSLNVRDKSKSLSLSVMLERASKVLVTLLPRTQIEKIKMQQSKTVFVDLGLGIRCEMFVGNIFASVFFFKKDWSSALLSMQLHKIYA